MNDVNIYNQEIKQAFHDYLERGLDPLPIPPLNGHPTKGPIVDGWQLKAANREFTEGDFPSGSNIGNETGGPKNATDIDLDWPRAVAVGNTILDEDNEPTLIFGHPSKKRSHYYYFTDQPLPYEAITDPMMKPKDPKAVVIEYRADRGHQTVFPPSLHYDAKTGEIEQIYFEDDSADEPLFIESVKLHRQFRLIGAITLLAQYFPEESGRHNTRLALAGVLARAKMPEDEATRIVTLAYRHSSGFADDEFKAAGDVRDVYAKFNAPDYNPDVHHLYGYDKLIESIDEKVVNRVLELLDIWKPGAEKIKTKPGSQDNTVASTTEIDTALATIQMLRDKHLTKIPVAPVVYLVEPEIQKGVITCVSGKSGHGKSTLVTMWCMWIAEQNPDMTILYLDAENGQAGVNERMDRLGPLPENFLFWGNWVGKDIHAIHSRELDTIIKLLKPVVVIDTMRSFFQGKENDNSDMAAFFKPIRKWTGYGATPIVLHHTDKEGRYPYCGASALPGEIDVGLLITSTIKDMKIERMHVTNEDFKGRGGILVNLDYHMVNGAPVRQAETKLDKLLSFLSKHPDISKEAFIDLAMKANFGPRQWIRDNLEKAKFAKKSKHEKGSIAVIGQPATAKQLDIGGTFADVFDEEEDELREAKSA